MAPRDPSSWLHVNRANWESRVPIHAGPGGYDLAAFDDPAYLPGVVRYDVPRLGALDGLDVVHLQCHIGTDTVSLSRLGASSVVGLDFSPKALDAARGLASRAGARVDFVEANVYDAMNVLGGERFDVVYTGIGALCWLPSVARWAEVVAGLLRPGGRVFLREGHPIVWALSEPRPDKLLVLEYPYFETEGVPFKESTTYAGTGRVESEDIVHFNHGLGEIFNALMAAGLTLTGFEEHREAPWNALGDAMTASPDHPGEYMLAEGRDRLPLTYTLRRRSTSQGDALLARRWAERLFAGRDVEVLPDELARPRLASASPFVDVAARTLLAENADRSSYAPAAD